MKIAHRRFIFISSGDKEHHRRPLSSNVPSSMQKPPISPVTYCRSRAAIELNEWKIHIAHQRISANRISNARNRERAPSLYRHRHDKDKRKYRRKKRKNGTEKAKMSFYSIERGWSLSYTVFPDHHRRRRRWRRRRWLLAFAFCSRSTEHCSLNFETRKITFYQVEYNFATCFFSLSLSISRRMRHCKQRDCFVFVLATVTRARAPMTWQYSERFRSFKIHRRRVSWDAFIALGCLLGCKL